MNTLMALPLEVRLAILFVAGICAGSLVNWAVGALAWTPRPFSPWSSPPEGLAPRGLKDRIPLLGWWWLRRESSHFGRLHWLRPMFIESGMGIFFAWLYWWEVAANGLLPSFAFQAPPPGFHAAPDLILMLHLQLSIHLLLTTLMCAASWIDIDEKIIPDTITLPGTLLGLVLTTAYPWGFLPGVAVAPTVKEIYIDFVGFYSPNQFPDILAPAPSIPSLLLALGCLWLWCFGLLPRPWRPRHGLRRAFTLMVARIARERFSLLVGAIGLVTSIAVATVWLTGGVHWQALLTSLVGIVGGGFIVWSVRVIGWYTLRREAMGFGDVTLMAMIGAFLGWQACLVTFFLAPFAGLLLGVMQWVTKRENEIPYGPFLCLAALLTVVRWSAIWDYISPLCGLGWLLPAVVVVCLALMAALLLFMRFIKNMLASRS